MNQELAIAVRYFRHRGLGADRPNTEYAALANLNERTVRRSRAAISKYYTCAPRCTPSEASLMDRRLITHVMSNTELNSFRDLLGALCGYLLVYRDKDLKTIMKTSQIVKLGNAYSYMLTRILSRKDYSTGVPVHSSNEALIYLRRIDKTHPFFSKHFMVSGVYNAGVSSKRYTLTKRSEALVKKLGILLKNNLIAYVQLLAKHLEEGPTFITNYSLRMVPYNVHNIHIFTNQIQSLQILYQPPLICLADRRTYVRHKDCISLNACQVANLSIPSLLQIMNIAALGTDRRSIIVPLKNLSSSNPNYGRHYNIFTNLRSTERKAMGYHNYDISSGIQIISFGILFEWAGHLYKSRDDLVDAYPMIFNYGWDPDYKKEIRTQLSKVLGKPIAEIKALLTAYANGGTEDAGNDDLLTQFREESDQLRRDVISSVEVNDTAVRKRAVSQSKYTFPANIDWADNAKDDDLAKAKASVYFFIWTYYEKQIRDAMLSVIDDGIPVHDAIYSKHEVPFATFEKAILEKTGFEVRISN